MHQLIADTLDDLLLKVFPKILQKGERIKASKGWNRELSGVVLELRNPLARLSRTETKGTVFSCLGETLWYLARSNELQFIKYYINMYGKFAEADGTVHGAYGPRLFGMRAGINQIDNVIKLLRRKPTSRQAVVQLFNAEDLLKDYGDIPCTCTMQFFIRKGSLHMVGCEIERLESLFLAGSKRFSGSYGPRRQRRSEPRNLGSFLVSILHFPWSGMTSV
jgi:thymidylate synthase